MPFHKGVVKFIKRGGPAGFAFRQGQSAFGRLGDALRGPDPLRADDERLNIDPDNLLRQRFEDLDPEALFRMFSRILQGSSLTPQQFLGPGVSSIQASEQAEAFNRRREGRAFDAASMATLGFEQLRGEALEDYIAANQFKSSARLFDRYFRQRRTYIGFSTSTPSRSTSSLIRSPIRPLPGLLHPRGDRRAAGCSSTNRE